MALEIRTAVVDDLPVLLEFEQGIIIAERPYDPMLKPDPISYYNIKELIESDNAEVIVGVMDGIIVGSAYIDIKTAKPYLRHEKYGYLGFMYVRPEYRGKGVNKRIIEELIVWAKSKDLEEVRLDVYDENVPAVRAYEKAGFVKDLVNMRLNI